MPITPFLLPSLFKGQLDLEWTDSSCQSRSSGAKNNLSTWEDPCNSWSEYHSHTRLSICTRSRCTQTKSHEAGDLRGDAMLLQWVPGAGGPHLLRGHQPFPRRALHRLTSAQTSSGQGMGPFAFQKVGLLRSKLLGG